MSDVASEPARAAAPVSRNEPAGARGAAASHAAGLDASPAPVVAGEASGAIGAIGAIGMVPSGPIPRPESVASGSGPHDPGRPSVSIDACSDAGTGAGTGSVASGWGGHDAGRPSASVGGGVGARSGGGIGAGPGTGTGIGSTGGDRSAAAAAPGLTPPSGPADMLRAWNDVLGELEAMRKLSLLGPFQHARVMQWTPELVELGFPVDVHSMGEMARDSADELRTILRSRGPAFKNLRVAVRLLDASESSTTVARSVLEDSRERTSAERSRREAEARAHPITRHVLQTFGAQIKEIKTDV